MSRSHTVGIMDQIIGFMLHTLILFTPCKWNLLGMLKQISGGQEAAGAYSFRTESLKLYGELLPLGPKRQNSHKQNNQAE